jgi:hypothetical protein
MMDGFDDLGFAKVDLLRRQRQGFPEVVLCERKTPAQTVAVMAALHAREPLVLATRATRAHATAVRRRIRTAQYHADARCLTSRPIPTARPDAPLVGVLAAGTSDLPVAEEAALTAACFGLRIERAYDVGVAGLHRLLAQHHLLRNANALIVVAGMEGALPSVVAGLTACPVVAVPTSTGYGTGAGGFAALLAMLNACGSGVTVVNVDNGFGAGFAVGRMLGRPPTHRTPPIPKK